MDVSTVIDSGGVDGGVGVSGDSCESDIAGAYTKMRLATGTVDAPDPRHGQQTPH
jgi:hypothetical protein